MNIKSFILLDYEAVTVEINLSVKKKKEFDQLYSSF